jgi:hypothetical protein
MIWGLPTATFTQLHVIISLIGIGSGLLVMYGLIKAKPFNGATLIFLLTTVLTSVTGFAFPNEHVTPGMIVGGISLVMLALAIAARYLFHLGGAWRGIYVITAMISLYLNCFVLVVQLFEKVPGLHALAPNGKEPPFAIAQVTLMVIFIILTVMSVKKFHPVTAIA